MKYIIFLFAIAIGSCSSSKKSNETSAAKQVPSESSRHYLLVTLEDDVTEKHLTKVYEADGIESVRKNNRTKNIYACQCMKDQNEMDILMSKIKEDAKILNVEEAKTILSPPTNSTNSKSAKARPGKN